jgi:exodeoxyribonuclease-5
MMKLSQEQKYVLKELSKVSKDVQILGGYAGTGKTTLISHLSQVLEDFGVCAYTGKAANVLRRKGMSASTIHSLIYKPEDDGRGGVRFVLIPPEDLQQQGFLVDEASMVSRDIYQDLLSFGRPIIFVGDHGQLEPVGEDVNLMKNPDFRLEEIHRNAGEIAFFAEWIRKGYRPQSFEHQSAYSGKKIHFVRNQEAVRMLTDVDQIICAFNKTRVGLNMQVREKLGFSGDTPQREERVMCLRNDKQKGLFNGMQGVVQQTYPRKKYSNPKLRIETDDGERIETFYDVNQFNKIKYDFQMGREEPAPFDFAYAITCHKAQGDEWERVMVMEQRCDLWDHKRWAYTAASRARNKVVWVE